MLILLLHYVAVAWGHVERCRFRGVIPARGRFTGEIKHGGLADRPRTIQTLSSRLLTSPTSRTLMLVLIRAILKRLARILDVVAEPRHGVARAQERCDAQDYEQDEGRQRDSFVHCICLCLSGFGTRIELGLLNIDVNARESDAYRGAKRTSYGRNIRASVMAAVPYSTISTGDIL